MRLTTKPDVTVLITTYKRGRLIKYALEGLKFQTFTEFETLIVLKPSDDESETIIDEYKKYLNIRLILQKHGSIVNAINLGIHNAHGRVIIFLDDDAVPFPNWIEQHLKHYQNPTVGGVGGDVISVNITGDYLTPVDGKSSQIIPELESKDFNLNNWFCNEPIDGLENFLVYVSKNGIVNYNYRLSEKARNKSVNSLLGMGANMSVLAGALKDFYFSNNWIRGLALEQFLGLYLWRNGYNLVFEPNAKVNHIIHGETLSRNISDGKTDLLRFTENNLLFYRLYDVEPGLSLIHRCSWLIFDSILNIIKFCKNREFSYLTQLKSKFYSEYIGFKWILSKKLGLNYSPLYDLKKLE